jgi:uncharacterized protein (DUF305 family)
MKPFTKWLIVGMAGLALGTASAQMSGMNMGSMGTKASEALKKLSGRAYDIAWMSQMIEHHRGALVMSQDCVKVCERAEVKKAAQTIINDQTKEIKQLEGWLRTWYNAKPDAKQMALMREDNAPMMQQTKAGMAPMSGMSMPIDQSFLEGMIAHHEMAVMMGQDALKKANKPELKKFAQSVINAQSKEIKQFKAWLK